MKNSTILSIIGLLMFSIIGLTQISSAEVSSVGEITTVPAPAIPTITPSTPTPTTSPLKKCGVNSFGVSNECGLNVYKSVHVQCYDGYETNLGAVESSCKSSELWQQYAKEACANRCSIGGRMSITPISVPIPTPITPPTQRPVVVAVDICNEVLQWETKIAYYKKLNNLSEDELNKSGFRREEVGKIIEELSSGIEKVRIQCNNKNNTVPAPINEIVKPVVVESGPEISTYYKAKLEKVSSIKNGGENQIQELKALRNEIDKLISNLIKSRNELEAGELNTLVKEVKVSQGEINADNIKVETTGKKIFVDVGDRAVSVEPTVDQVLIRDKGLKVNTDEVMIKENVMSVGGVPVEMSASEVAEKLGLLPTTIELKKENENAVYNMQINERRKLFGLIPFNSEKTVTANAQNGEVLGENHPWYNFLTTK